jgi:hypothetical protein
MVPLSDGAAEGKAQPFEAAAAGTSVPFTADDDADDPSGGPRGVKAPPNRGALKGTKGSRRESGGIVALGSREPGPVVGVGKVSESSHEEPVEEEEEEDAGDGDAGDGGEDSDALTDPSGPSDDDEREVPVAVTTKMTPALALVSSLAACSTLAGACAVHVQ